MWTNMIFENEVRYMIPISSSSRNLNKKLENFKLFKENSRLTLQQDIQFLSQTVSYPTIPPFPNNLCNPDKATAISNAKQDLK